MALRTAGPAGESGLLWFGWYGFNAGSEFRVDATTATAFINTDLAASFAGVAWMLVEWMTARKPKFLGLLTDSVAGLATITPAGGYPSPQSAVLIGIVAGGAQSGRARASSCVQLTAALGREVASLTVPSWNRLRDWLREMDGLRAVLGGMAA
jgi:hypothetical protein